MEVPQVALEVVYATTPAQFDGIRRSEAYVAVTDPRVLRAELEKRCVDLRVRLTGGA